ncbi:hypothetical protein ACNOYE_36110 [Nannocystaceae bacterium ST9]
MIAYEILVQTIADWKAGVRPTAPTPPVQMHASAGQPEAYEEIESGVVDVGEDVDAEPEAEVEWSEEQPREEYEYDEQG